jgi:hypothetical protein
MRRRFVALLACLTALSLPAPRAAAVDLQATVKVPGQVRDGYFGGDTEAPFWLYTDLGVNRIRHGINAETYFSLNDDFATERGGGDFYAGVLRIPNAIPYTSASLGRQFLGEGPRGGNLADAGRVTLDTGGPVALSVWGGQPEYFEPTFSSPSISQDEQMFGARVIATGLTSSHLNVGYLQHIRDGRTLSELVSLNAGRRFADLAGRPNVYGHFAYDADNANVHMAQLGTQATLMPARLLGSLEAAYYDPQGTRSLFRADPNLAEDPLFQALSFSNQLRFRGTLRYLFSDDLSAYTNLGYQRYEVSDSVYSDGYLGGAGLRWLPGGDGLESVRVEYYVADSRGGNLNGVRLYYDNWVYDRIHFRTKVDVAYYEKITNQQDTAVATLMGLGYDLLPGLYCEVYLEGNRNERFDADMRFGLNIVYNWTHRFGQQSSPPATAAAPAPAAAAEGA